MGLLNTLINRNRFNLTLPGGFKYCGPGNPIEQQLINNDPPLNQLDRECKDHDEFYLLNSKLKDRHQADSRLATAAWKRVKARDSSLKERLAGLLVTGAMKAKLATGSGVAVRFPTTVPPGLMRQQKEGQKKKKKKSKTKTKKGAGRVRKGHQRQSIKRGGAIPLGTILMAIPALASAISGATTAWKNWKGIQNQKNLVNEMKRHNTVMEGKGAATRFPTTSKRQQKKRRGKGLILKQWKAC